MDYDPLSHEFLPISFHWGSCSLPLLYMCIYLYIYFQSPVFLLFHLDQYWGSNGRWSWYLSVDDIGFTLRWRHNGRDNVSNHQPHDSLLNRLLRRKWKKYQSSAALAFYAGIHRGPVNSPHKWPVTRKMFPFDDVIMAFIKSGDSLWYMFSLKVQELLLSLVP